MSMFFSEQDIYLTFLNSRPHIQRFLNHRLHCQETAADLVQDIYLRLMLLKPPPRNETEVRAWLFTVAANLSVDHLRRQKRRGELLDRYLEPNEADDAAAPERLVQARDQLGIVQSALAELPDQCAEILFFSRVEGLSHAQIAKNLGISCSWVEKQLARALLHCRKALDRPER